VLTSTNRDLETEVHDQRFREDLFYRINVVQIAVPSLRDRTGDILTLAQHFINQISVRTRKAVRGISVDAARLLKEYDWPGNVRELENCMARAVALCRLDEITAEDLPAKMQGRRSSQIALTADPPSGLLTMEEMEHHYIHRVLHAVGGNKSRAARVLGLDRRSLYRRLAASGALVARAAMPGSRGDEGAR
jgi:DNA-binding NtrC family response regulator